MSSITAASMVLNNTPPGSLSPQHDSERLSFGGRDSHSSARSRRSLFKGLSSKKHEPVHVLCPENIAVEFIDSKAGIVNPQELRRIARRELRRDRSSSVTSETPQDSSE